ncbi:DUF4861 domain-containing protein [Pinibacter soli]|uniref:DUF4861 domain-containing protein n=1 Tax=Pinibacter soli TaxID=3044211 RepID=A0ABT6REL8_9BACT|nr:DUF4861 domain-containing protein [Pinibacter soli]MDI3321023.1 DUF4861 domain-containing protein [Pinibacter soli]
MTKKFLTSLLLAASTTSLFALDTGTLVLKNKSSLNRENELIVLKRSSLQSKIKNLQPNEYLAFIANGKSVPVQFDDIDGDGKWDEAALIISFAPKESIKLQLQASKNMPQYQEAVFAHVRQKHKNPDQTFGPLVLRDTMPFNNPPTDFSKVVLPPYLTEGPAWENDKVAFRLYFDARNCKDIYGKRISGMVMDTVGSDPKNSYHNFSNWGMDILRVGKSLGAGALAIRTKTSANADTLIRVGGSAVKSEIFRVISDGPLRVMFEMTYSCVINNKPFTITERTSIWKGQYFYQSDLTISGLSATDELVTGMADFYENNGESLKSNNQNIYYSYGTQSENKDKLALGISVSNNSHTYMTNANSLQSEIKDTWLVSQPVNNGKVSFRFYALWEKTNTAFSSKEGVRDYFNKELELMASPVEVK